MHPQPFHVGFLSGPSLHSVVSTLFYRLAFRRTAPNQNITSSIVDKGHKGPSPWMRFFIIRLVVIYFQNSDTKMGSNENSGPALVSQDIGGEMTTGRMFQGNA